MSDLARAQLVGVLEIAFRNQGEAPMKPLVTDELWAEVEPLLPPAPPRRFRFPGHKPLDYRKILTGILFVLKTGIALGRPAC
jgi:hypothetical protein